MLNNQVLSNKKIKKKLPWILISFGLFALFCIVSVFGYYKYIFSNFKIDANAEHFGQFGDFIGGTLNPILAFLSFMALLYTIKIQTDELKLSREELEETRKELKGSRIAQQEQSVSLKLQNKATELQIFENTFFQLLNQHNEYLDLMVKENKLKYTEWTSGDEYDNGSINNPLTIDELNLEFKRLNNDKRTIKNYFMTLYQILKFINEKSEKYNIDEKFYTNIVRALIDENVLKTLAVNCITYDFKKYKEYIETYNFFEHIYIEKRTIETETILNILSKFDSLAFGKNESLKHLIKENK